MDKTNTENCLIFKYDSENKKLFCSVISDRRTGKDRRAGKVRRKVRGT
jgi:hypothetical protein